MRPRIDRLGRPGLLSPAIREVRFGLEEESNPLASAPAQGRRRAVRAQSLAILHKVGCSWSARPAGVLRSGSAGPTTQPRFEPMRSTPAGRQTGEPTVSHEGCSGFDSSCFSIGRPSRLMIRHKSSARLSVIVDVDLVVDAQALTLTAAKRHVVVDSTVVVARGPAARSEPAIRDYEGLGRRRGQTSTYRCAAVDVKAGVNVQVDVKHGTDCNESGGA